MNPKNNVDPDDESLGVLDDTPSSDTTGIGLIGGTAQVSVAMPTGGDDDDLDDEVVDDELVDAAPPAVVTDLIIDTSAVADAEMVARIQQEAPDIVIELPAEAVPAEPVDEQDTEVDEPGAENDEVVAEIVDDETDVDSDGPDTDPDEPDDELHDADVDSLDDAEADHGDAGAEVFYDLAGSDAAEHIHADEAIAEPADAGDPSGTEPDAESELDDESEPAHPALADELEQSDEDERLDEAAPSDEVEDAGEPLDERNDAADLTADEEPVDDEEVIVADALDDGFDDAPDAAVEAGAEDGIVEATFDEVASAGSEKPESDPVDEHPADISPTEDAAVEDGDIESDAHQEPIALIAVEQKPVAPASEESSSGAPAPHQAPAAEEEPAMASTDPAPVTRRAAARAADVALGSKRLGDLDSASSSESADLLTADRLLDPSRVAKPEPEGTWSHLLYSITGGRINVGDSRKARERKQLTARISAPLSGSARFVPVLSRKGGVGKTTVTALLGMALADARDDRVIAVDANPDRGTLAERVVGTHTRSVRDLVRAQGEIRGFHDVSALVARDETRLDVLASDADPRVSEAFGDADYRDVATVAAQYYSLVLTDSGTGIVHSVMGATLDLADQLVIVSGLSVDEARLASETLTWLETNGYADLARQSIVVLNQSTPGAPLVRLSELEAHFSSRASHVLRIPYDPQIAGGGAIDFASLQPATRQAAREIAAALIEGLRTRAA